MVDYELAGFGLSDDPPISPSAIIIATGLDVFLKAAKFKQPHIIVGHSWGVVLTMETMALRLGDISGMVVVDTTGPRYVDVAPSSCKQLAMTTVNEGLKEPAARGGEKAYVL